MINLIKLARSCNPVSLVFILFAGIFLIAEYNMIGDFNIFLLASKALKSGENIYTITYVEGFKYFYSPLFAILIYPFTLIPKELAGLIWNLFGFIMLARTFMLINKLFIPKKTIKNRNTLKVIVFAAMLFPIYSNFHSTQMSAFILYAMIESINLISYRKNYILGATLLALAINVKILGLSSF